MPMGPSGDNYSCKLKWDSLQRPRTRFVHCFKVESCYSSNREWAEGVIIEGVGLVIQLYASGALRTVNAHGGSYGE